MANGESSLSYSLSIEQRWGPKNFEHVKPWLKQADLVIATLKERHLAGYLHATPGEIQATALDLAHNHISTRGVVSTAQEKAGMTTPIGVYTYESRSIKHL